MLRTTILGKFPLRSETPSVSLRAMVSMRAVEAVLLIHIDRKAVVAMTTRMTILASACTLFKI